MDHSRSFRRLGLVLSIVLVGLLSLPAIQTLRPILPNGRAGYPVPLKAARPGDFTRAWFDGSLQRWLEALAEADVGFRPVLVRSFNEAAFHLFRDLPRASVLATDHDVYTYPELQGLNALVARKAYFEDGYRALAPRLRSLQEELARRGKHFEVIIATSKALVSLDGVPDRYLVAPREDMYRRAADVSAILKENGVNVVDGTGLLRRIRADGISTHATSGVHWNRYSGCAVARQLLEDSRRDLGDSVAKLGCDPPQLGPPWATDVDGLTMFELLTRGGLVTPTSFPTLTPGLSGQTRFLFVGDSFCFNVIDAIALSHAAGALTFRIYYLDRYTFSPKDGAALSYQALTAPVSVADIYNDVAGADVVVLEMVDFNLNYFGFGFVEQMLDLLRHQPDGEPGAPAPTAAKAPT